MANGKHQYCKTERKYLHSSRFFEIKNDEFSSQGQLCDQNNRFDLDDMRFAINHFYNGVFELHSDEQSHDHPEYILKYPVIERIEGPINHHGIHFIYQPP